MRLARVVTLFSRKNGIDEMSAIVARRALRENLIEMKRNVLIVSIVFVLCVLLTCFVACGDKDGGKMVDYVSQLKLDMNSTSLKKVVTIKNYVDGDTTHFWADVDSTGVVKARYLAINTPESTGRIEEYGKQASKFTKEKLKNATSILIESDNDKWNTDANGRYLVWVWYKTSDDAEWRNLNIEILQNGLAIASNTAENRYGTTAMAALNQAQNNKLKIFSGEKDPEMYYGEAQEITLKELRCNIESYSNVKVAFEGNIVLDSGGSVYIEEYDEETGIYFGISVYYGTANLSATGMKILTKGNRVRIVGSVQYYETGDLWQISGLQYKPRDPKNPDNIQKIEDEGGHEPAYPLVDAATFLGKITIQGDDEAIEMDYANATLNTSIAMNELTVKSIYTTTAESSSSVGAMTFTCQTKDGKTVYVRTTVLKDEDGNTITKDAYLGKTINVKGFVDKFDGDYQIKVFSPKNITIVA